jgi:8-oxo-dGTP pyrophosphatase MutT (NUDIX family)
MLKTVVAKYLELYPEDKLKLKLLLTQLENKEELDDRRNFTGHIAGDAIILSPDHQKILYIFHKRSGRWQQPGGHWDKNEAGPWLTSEREAIEETGVKLAKRINPVDADRRIPLHIVTGPVPPSAAKKEPQHWHHDFRYGFIAKSEELDEVQDDGITQAKWFKLEDALALRDTGHYILISIQRMRKLLN